MHEPITSEIFQVGGPLLTSPNDAASYLIKVGGRGAPSSTPGAAPIRRS